MSFSKSLESEIIRWTRVISLIGLVGLLLLSAITVGEVVSRSLLGLPVIGVADLSRLIIAIVIASCFPLVSAARRHITVRAVGSLLGPRAHAGLEAFAAFAVLCFFCLMTWQLWLHTRDTAEINETTWVLLWPVAPWWGVTTVLVALCIPAQLFCCSQSLRLLFFPASSPEPEGGEKTESTTKDKTR